VVSMSDSQSGGPGCGCRCGGPESLSGLSGFVLIFMSGIPCLNKDD